MVLRKQFVNSTWIWELWVFSVFDIKWIFFSELRFISLQKAFKLLCVCKFQSTLIDSKEYWMCMQSDSLSNLRMKLSGATVFNCCLWASLLDDRIAFSYENQLVSILIHQDKRRQQHREREWNLDVHTKVSNFRINWFLLFRSITFSLHKAAAAVALHLTNVKRWEKFVRARWANWGQNVGQPSDAICSWLSRQIVWEKCNTNNQNWLRLKSEIRSPATQLRDWDPIRSLKVEQTSRIFFHYQIAIRFCNFLLLHWRLEKSNAIHNYPSISIQLIHCRFHVSKLHCHHRDSLITEQETGELRERMTIDGMA